MKGKRFLSLLLCLIMVLGMLPGLATSVMAADSDILINACTVNASGDFDSVANNAIDMERSTYTCEYDWMMEEEYSSTPFSELGGIVPEVYPGDGYDLTLQIYLKQGYSFTDSTGILISTSNTSFSKVVNTCEGVTQTDGSRIYTLKSDEITEDYLYIYIPVKQTSAKKCVLTLYPKVGSQEKTTVEVTQGETLPDLSQALMSFDSEYFSVADVDWYTVEPEKLADGTYQYDEGKKLAANAVIADNMSLYAKPKVKDGAKLMARASLPMHDSLLDSNLTNLGRLMNWVYTPAKKAEELNFTDAVARQAQLWKLPVGSVLTAEDTIPAVGSYQDILTNAKAVSIPKKGALLNAWRYKDYDNVWHEVKVGEQISSDFVLKMLYRGTSVLTLYPNVTFTNTITLDTGAANLNLGPFVVTSDDIGQVSHAEAFKTEESTAVETAIQVKENTDGFKKLFRGWYLSKDFRGTAIDLKTQHFCSDATLYARWENAYTLTYDFGDFHPTNVNATVEYAAKTVANGDLLTKPATPTAGDAAFRGWYKDEAWTQEWDFAKDTVEGNMTLYAKFEDAKQIPVTFKFARANDLNTPETAANYPNTPIVANYPFGPLPVLPVKSRTELIPGTMDKRTIYYDDEGGKRTLTYDGWKFTDPTTGQDHDMTENTVLADYFNPETTTSVDIIAKYTMSFQFTFDLDGGTTTKLGEVQTKTINGYTGTISEPTVKPTKAGYDFGGWVDAATGVPFDFSKSYNENTTIKAKWVAEQPHKVRFKLTPANAEMRLWKTSDPDTIIQPKSRDDDGNVVYELTKAEYTFAASAEGYMAVSGKKTVTEDWSDEDAAAINEITLTPFQAVTDIELNIPENKIMQKKSYDLGSLATVKPETAPTKVIKWTVKTANDGVTLGEDGTLTVPDTAVVGSTVTLTATITEGALSSDGTEKADYKKDFTLTITKYLATISFDHGTGDHPNVELPKPQSVKDDSTLDAPTLSASGWTFDGWYKEAACTTKWKAEDMFDADTKLYAKWTKNPVDVTITFAGGEGATLNTNLSSTHNGKSGDAITLPPCMYTKPGYIFRSWDGTFAGTSYTLPEEAKTFTAAWTQISEAISEDDITHALDGLTVNDVAIATIQKYKPQLLAVRDALAAGTATKTDATLIAKLSGLFEAAGLGPVSIDGDARNGVSEVGAILSAAEGKAVALTVNKLATPIKTLPDAYKNTEYKAVWYNLSMTVGGATTTPKVPVILTMPIPADLSEMAADTIRVLLYKGAETQPVIMTPTVNGSNLTFAYDGNGDLAIVGKAISDAKDTRVTALEMRYNGTKMGNVEQDANGNFTVTLPSTTSESVLQDLASGINSKWITYMTVAPQAKVKPAEGGEQTAEYWAKTGVTLTYSLTSDNKYSATQSFTVTAGDGTTTRTFTVTVKKITDADRTYKIAVSNISGGTVTATPNPAAAGEEVKLTVEPNDGKKLIAGSLSYCLQSAGAKSVPIDENTRTFIMPAGDININAQFEDDASAPIKNPPQITAFMINGVSAVINSDTKAITIILPYGTDLKHVAPTIVTANASKVEPSSAQRVDLSTPKAYRVYASNGAYVTYTVTAYTEEPSPTQSLWEKLQNQINSNPNWWELAEYQKKTGYYK